MATRKDVIYQVLIRDEYGAIRQFQETPRAINVINLIDDLIRDVNVHSIEITKVVIHDKAGTIGPKVTSDKLSDIESKS